MLDLAPVMPWITAALSIIAFLTTMKNILGSPAKENTEKITKLESKLIDHDRRVQAIEGELKHMPDRETAHRLELAMERIAGRLDAMDERMRPIANTNHRLQEFLLEQAQK